MPNDEFPEAEDSKENKELNSEELFANVEETEAFKAEEQEAVLEAGAKPVVEAEEEDGDDVESFEGEEDFDYEQDPVENAFDLDKGTPMRGQRSRDFKDSGLPSNTRIESVKEFFKTEVVYRFDILNETEREELKGNYRFDILGDKNDTSAWMLIVDGDLSVEEGGKDADLVVEVSESDFLNLVNGKINPQLAVLANKLNFRGQIDTLFKVNNLIFPGD